MPIKHVHKSPASINEKPFFYMNFSSVITQMKKEKLFSMSTFFVELISILINASIYFSYDFDFIFLY